MKRLTLLLVSAILCHAVAQAVEIHGKVTVDRKAVVLVICATDTTSITLQPDTKDYALAISPKTTAIATFFVVYEDDNGTKRQMYTPFCVDSNADKIAIDIVEKGTDMLLTSSDPDAQAFIAYSVFLKEQFMANVALEEAEGYLQLFRDKAQQLSSTVKYPLSSDYLFLWGASSRNMAAIMLRHQYGKQLGEDKKAMLKEVIPSVESLIDNPATKYFPEFVNVVASVTTKGSNLQQRIANLHHYVSNAELAEIIEYKLIQKFVKDKGEQGKDVAYNLAMLDSVASHRPEYAEWKAKLSNTRSYTQAGDLAPEDILLDPSGKEVRLSDFQGKYIFIDLWASWCVYCIREFPALHKLEKEFESDDLVFISLSIDTSTDAWHSALNRLKLEGNQFIVSSSAFSEKLEIAAVPRYLIYDKQGRLIDGNAPRPSETEKITFLLRNLK